MSDRNLYTSSCDAGLRPASFRFIKQKLRDILLIEDDEHCQSLFADLISNVNPISLINPLIGFLTYGYPASDRASVAIGKTARIILDSNPCGHEDIINVIRRFMWHMNEESGNIGWGIPGAFAEILIFCPEFVEEYSHILISYVLNLGHEDNFCDNVELRRECFEAIRKVLLKYRKMDLFCDKNSFAYKSLKLACSNESDEICLQIAKQSLEILQVTD